MATRKRCIGISLPRKPRVVKEFDLDQLMDRSPADLSVDETLDWCEFLDCLVGTIVLAGGIPSDDIRVLHRVIGKMADDYAIMAN
jgi:hypothetical protein